MRTTVDIPDDTYRRLKIKAAEEGVTVRSLILRGVDRTLGEPQDKPKREIDFPLIRSARKDKIDLTREQVSEAMFG